VPTLIEQEISGIILKSEPPDKLMEAIYSIMQGESWFSAALIPTLMQPTTPKSHELTNRELEVLKLLAQENTNIAIAHTLNISERTVRCHLESIYNKLGVASRVGAAIQAIKLNIISE